MKEGQPVVECSFAYPGAYGHECGKPAVVVVVQVSKQTADGVFYAGRCAECAKIKGGENARIVRREEVKGQRNLWQ